MFRTSEANPGATLKSFQRYVERIKLMNQLIFRKADGTPYQPTDAEQKAMLLFKGGDDMKNLFDYVGKVVEGDTFEEAITKIREGLQKRTNKVVQRNMLFTDFPQGNKSFERWSQEISTAAQLISYQDYDWKQATVDAILLQTTSPKLRERALQENTSYDALMTMGIAKEQSAKGAALLEQASGSSTRVRVKAEEEVKRLQFENLKLKGREKLCHRCGYDSCKQGTKCPANGQRCHKCGKENHLSRACKYPLRKNHDDGRRKTRKNKKKINFGQLSSAEESDSEESSGRVVVGHLSSKSIAAKVNVTGLARNNPGKKISLATDTGISKTLLNRGDWETIKENCTFVKTSKRFRPYGTAYHLPIRGKAKVKLTAERGAATETWIYVVDDKKEQSLLGEADAIALGIVTLDLKGSPPHKSDAEVINKIEYGQLSFEAPGEIVSGGETQAEIDKNMKQIMKDFPKLFSDSTGKVKGPPIKIQVRDDATPVIQPGRRIPLHYMEKLKSELERMKREDIIEGPIEIEVPGTFLSNIVITDKKDTGDIRVTLDCQEVNKVIYPTHEPIPTSDELRHNLIGCDRFSTLDMTNCYHQFEIEENARKLYAFRTPWGIYRYKRMVMGTSPASSEIQKRIRAIVNHLPGAIHIKDDILIHGVGTEHDKHLKRVCETLQKNGITVRPKKCHLGQPSVKWFGQIYSRKGVSPDPEKCKIIKNWPAPKNSSEVKSFLQTVQFNAKFMGGKAGESTYPDLTAPLRNLTKKYARFRWGKSEEDAFIELKKRLCSDRVLVPYDLSKKTRLYVDSSPVGTQATVCQLEEGNHWRPVSHSSRPWTSAEAGYGQIERESLGICTGMYMNKMYTLGTHVEVVTDHEPLVTIYNNPSKPKQLRVDRHRTKLLPFSYNVVYEEGTKTPCDYGSRHPEEKQFSESEISEWCVETGTDIFVNRVLEELLPSAITLDMVRRETREDKDMKLLKEYVVKHDLYGCKKNLPEYCDIFQELTVIDNVVLKGNQIVIPTSLRADVIGLAHEGHQYSDKTLSLLRQSCWFPKMRRDVLDYVGSCVGCLSAISRNTVVPLEPNFLPERAWQNLHADFKGPIGGQYYFHVLIDQYSKYPEVDLVTSTSFKKLKPKLDRIFSAQGIPEKVSADNGPPYPCYDMEKYAAEMGFKMDLVTPEDPQSNGFAEAFVKILCKLLHTSVAEGKNPREELHKYLMHYRATPHPTTGRSPSEMLNNRKIRTKLPQFFPNEEDEEARETRKKHDTKKLTQKKMFDDRRRAKVKEVQPGDQVLIKQTKSTVKPPYDPKPYTVVQVDGNRIDAKRNGITRQRDKNSVKVVKKRPTHLVPTWERGQFKPDITDYTELDIEGCWPNMSEVASPQELNEEPAAVSIIEPIPDSEYSDGVLPDIEALGFHPVNDHDDEDSAEAMTADEEMQTLDHSQDEENAPETEVIDNLLSGQLVLPESPVPSRPRPLRKGDTIAFTYDEAGDQEWHTCKLVSRAGKAKGKYQMAWNISKDGVIENIDFERDVEEFRLIEAEMRQNDPGMVDHLSALIEAATQRELADTNDE